MVFKGKTRLWALVAAAALAGASACGSDASGEGDSIVIGVPLPLSGGVAELGKRAQQGITLAVEDINRDGGILGRQLRVEFQDDKCDPGEGVSAVRRLVTNSDVAALVGGSCSGVVLAAMPIIDGELSFVVTGASSPDITKQAGAGGNEWLFRVNPSDDAMAAALTDVMVTDQGRKRVGIVALNDDFGRTAADAFAEQVISAGGSVEDKQFYPVGGPYDFASAVTRFKALDLDAIVFAGTVEGGIPLVKEVALQQLNVPVYSRGLPLVPSTFDALGVAADGIHGSDPYYPEVDTSTNKEFLSRFQARFNEPPHFQAVANYEAMLLVKAAIEQAGSTDRDAVRQVIKDLSYQSITGGTVAFDANNQAHNKVFVAAAQCDATQCSVTIVGSRDS